MFRSVCMEILEGFGMFEGSRGFLGACLKTKKGIKETKWGKTRIHGGGGFLPPPNPPAKELCSGLGEALQNSLLHHHHTVVLLGFRGEDLLPPLLAGTGRGRSASTPHV